MGLSGDPVPPGIGNGAAVSRNSHRFRDAAAPEGVRVEKEFRGQEFNIGTGRGALR